MLMFQLGWAACVLGGNTLAIVYTVTALLIHHRYLMEEKNEWQLILSIAIFGVSWDSLLVFFGLINYSNTGWFSLPIWMICLWLLFATTFMHSLSWMARYLWLAAIGGAVFGPMSYWAGVELSAAYFGASVLTSMLVIAAGWLVLFPIGIYMAGKLKGVSKNSDFFVSARKHRAENRSVYDIHEASSTELTPQSRKKCIFRGGLKR